jgi:hypothetical protein
VRNDRSSFQGGGSCGQEACGLVRHCAGEKLPKEEAPSQEAAPVSQRLQVAETLRRHLASFQGAAVYLQNEMAAALVLCIMVLSAVGHIKRFLW